MRLEDIGFYTLSDERARDVARYSYGATCACDRVPSPLQRCELILTDRCNFRCEYCRGVKPQLRGDIPPGTAKAILDQWKEQGLRNVRFSGGEPTLYEGLLWLVGLTQGCEHVAISTNGSAPLNLYKALIKAGVNDVSVSLDACCSATTDIMSGVKDRFNLIVGNIKELARMTYVTVGVVVTEKNLPELRNTIELAQSLGVADVRVIPAAQYSRHLESLKGQIDLTRHPILRYRFTSGRPVRGLQEGDSRTCHLVADDMAVAGRWHFPCIIYLREGGDPIGEVGPKMREERLEWLLDHDSWGDPICRNNCLDVCIEHNNRVRDFQRDKVKAEARP